MPFPDPYAAWALPIFSLLVALLLVVGALLRRDAGTGSNTRDVAQR